jgi:hypothetical protein
MHRRRVPSIVQVKVPLRGGSAESVTPVIRALDSAEELLELFGVR